MDLYQFGLNAELVYESSIIGYNAQNIRFSHCCMEQCSDLTYCQFCFHSSYLFGCIGLRHKKNCIFNLSYTKHDYDRLRSRIIAHMKETGEWGEFFPISISTFGYNETVSQLYFPLTKSEAEKKGYKWTDEEVKTANTNAHPPPDTLVDTSDTLASQLFVCEASGKPFKLISQELKFYRKHNIPPPARCFQQRHRDRISRRNPRTICKRSCAQCNSTVNTSFSAETNYAILCESCYRNEMFGQSAAANA